VPGDGESGVGHAAHGEESGMSIGPQFWRNRSIPVDWRKLDTATEEPRVLDVEVEPIPGTDDA
jgi:hypothetical protein